MKKTLLITGVSGFIGSAVAQKMLNNGYQVIGLYNRNPPRIQENIQNSFIPYQCKLDDSEQVGQLFQEVRNYQIEAIIHIAGLALDWGPYKSFHDANVKSTQHLIDQAINQNIKIFINTSTMAVHGFGTHHVDSTEDGPYTRLITPYQKTKLVAESIVKEASTVLRTVTLRPGNVYGPGDTTTLYPILDAIKARKMGTIDRGKWFTNPIYIDDMVEAYWLALQELESEGYNSINGRSFNITNSEKVSWKEYLSIICSRSNLPEPKLNVPSPLAYILAGLLMGTFWLMRIKTPPPLTFYRVQQTAHHYHFSILNAKKLLGFTPKYNIHQGIERAVAMWQKNQ